MFGAGVAEGEEEKTDGLGGLGEEEGGIGGFGGDFFEVFLGLEAMGFGGIKGGGGKVAFADGGGAGLVEGAEKFGGVACGGLGGEVEVAKLAGEAAEGGLGGVEQVKVEGAGDVDLAVLGEGPAAGGAVEEAGEAHGVGLPVAGIAPIADEEALGGVGEGVGEGVLDVAAHVGYAPGDGVPGGGAGGDPEGDVGGGELGKGGGEGVVGFVAPIDGDAIAGELGNERGVVEDDVAPEAHGVAACFEGGVAAEEVVEVDAAFAGGIGLGL